MDDATAHLLAAARGDRGALGDVVAATQADVWRFCAHLVDVDSADDLTQATYLRALGAVDRFRGDASAVTWLLAIARHTCADELRRRVRRRGREVRVDTATAEAWPASPDDSPTGVGIDLERALSRLDHDRRVAFVLTQVLGLTYREAAVSAEVPVGTIRSRVARAREELVAGLGESVADADDSSRPGASESPRRWA